MNVVILAGGVGSRLWPMSRRARPKQFFEVIGEDSLIRDTYRRMLRLVPAEKIYIAIAEELLPLLQQTFPALPESQIIVEPMKRDTGPAMGLAAATLFLRQPDEPVVFVPADHYIGDEELFLRTLAAGDRLVRETGKLLDIGIKPTFPSTVLGYTKIGEKVAEVEGVEVFNFVEHREKPNYDMAKHYLESGDYLWHANYYCFTPRAFLDAFDRFAPALGEGLRAIGAALARGDRATAWTIFSTLPAVAFDYAVTEKMPAGEVLIMRGDFGWSDVGAWDTVYDHLSAGTDNVTRGRCVTIDTSESLIYAPADKLVAVVGMNNVVVVDTGDALLICRQQDAQRVKDIVTRLVAEGHQNFT